jgi:hemoglobin
MARSIFERCGGFATVSKIVMTFYDKVLDSELIGDYFEHVDMRRLIDHQTKFIAQVMGGPVAYADEALEQVHRPLGITGPAFAEMVRLLRETLEEVALPADDIDSVIAEIERRRSIIIGDRE